MNSKIVTAQPYFSPEEVEWVLQEMRAVLESGVLTSGPRVKIFEERFAEYVGCREAVAVSNGTSALELMLRHYGLDHEAEVIIPTNTFLATANAVLFAGGQPVMVDISGPDLCMGLEQIQGAITPRTRGVVVVHIAGLICPEMDAIRTFCREQGYFLLEDAAHAHGAHAQGVKAGALADGAAFSFFPTKPMTTAEGGMITTNSSAMADFARTFRHHGVKPGDRVHSALGHNCRLDELRATLGISQLRTLEDLISSREAVASVYGRRLAGLPGIQLPVVRQGDRHAYFKYPVLVDTLELRQSLARALESKDIQTGTVYWPACHGHPVAEDREMYRRSGDFPLSDDILPRVLCLPIHPRMNEQDAERVCSVLSEEICSARV